MIIRKAKVKELPIIMDLWQEFMKTHDKIVISANPHHKKHIARIKDARRKVGKHFRGCIYSGNALLEVFEDSGKLVGYGVCLIKRNHPINKTTKVGYISDLFIKPRYQGQKVSSKFKDHALDFFKRKGIKTATIALNPGNTKAHNIYRKWGFFDFHLEMWKELK